MSAVEQEELMGDWTLSGTDAITYCRLYGCRTTPLRPPPAPTYVVPAGQGAYIVRYDNAELVELSPAYQCVQATPEYIAQSSGDALLAWQIDPADLFHLAWTGPNDTPTSKTAVKLVPPVDVFAYMPSSDGDAWRRATIVSTKGPPP